MLKKHASRLDHVGRRDVSVVCGGVTTTPTALTGIVSTPMWVQTQRLGQTHQVFVFLVRITLTSSPKWSRVYT